MMEAVDHISGRGIANEYDDRVNISLDDTPLASGMVFSNEPMLVIPDEFGVRLEDHFYMTSDGPAWFTTPSLSIDDPFGH